MTEGIRMGVLHEHPVYRLPFMNFRVDCYAQTLGWKAVPYPCQESEKTVASIICWKTARESSQ